MDDAPRPRAYGHSIPKELQDKNRTSLVVGGEQSDEPKSVVVGAPHHAPAGVRMLRCDRVADQNTGLLAWAVAEILGVPAVIVTNAEMDPNKSLQSPYSETVASFRPRYLVEIHGHGGKKARHDIEVSAGSEARSDLSQAFASRLSEELSREAAVPDLSVCGDFRKVYYQAKWTVTMQSDAWVGVHVELPLRVRKSRPTPGLPPAGQALARCLAAAVTDVLAEAG